ncbi:MAG: cytochrome c-type biogenesis protein CcmH, partial [Gammaproteobacteria bacterium]
QELEDRYHTLVTELRCLVCQNQTIADSNADLAKDLRREVRDMLVKGKSDEEIKDFMLERYGDFVLYNPPFKPGTWILWLAPVLFGLIGLAVLIRMLRKRPEVALSEADQSRVDELLGGTGEKGA